MAMNALLSRERAAGYDPARLAAVRVLLIGAGALGQNLVLDLAFSQVGSICLVDFDHFEPHNATRSPCFPSPSERRRWGSSKAVVVAHKLRKFVSWSKQPRISYFAGPIEQFGDAPFSGATVAVSAVDRDATRVYLAAMTRKHAIPLVEGGFYGASLSLSIVANRLDGPCWLCHRAVEVTDQLKLSCTAQAIETENTGLIPATQPAAAALGALMAEATIQLGHGNSQIADRRVYLNVRTAQATAVRLTLDEGCSGRHRWPTPAFKICLKTDAKVSELLAQLAKRLKHPSVILPHRYIVTAPCRRCFVGVAVNKPEWALPQRLSCTACGDTGNRRAAADSDSLPLKVHTALSAEARDLLDRPLSEIGIAPGSVLEASDEQGVSLAFRLSGSFPLTRV
jgi:molybdopterin/thiamine biosynthesis adenylyltransferase